MPVRLVHQITHAQRAGHYKAIVMADSTNSNNHSSLHGKNSSDKNNSNSGGVPLPEPGWAKGMQAETPGDSARINVLYWVLPPPLYSLYQLLRVILVAIYIHIYYTCYPTAFEWGQYLSSIPRSCSASSRAAGSMSVWFTDVRGNIQHKCQNVRLPNEGSTFLPKCHRITRASQSSRLLDVARMI